MATEYMKVGDLPDSFMDVVMRAFSDYSVALSRVRDDNTKEFSPLGSGVLARKGNRFGILTARHCLHACTPEVTLGPNGRDTLTLILRGGRSLRLEPHEAIEHELVTPRSEEFGPDLTFIEVPPGERLASIKAIGSFWSLDRNVSDIIEEFGSEGTPIVTIGFPQIDYRTTISERSVHHLVRHMTYSNAIGKGDVFERDGWDYLESTCWYGGKAVLPNTFSGVSGGPVWGMSLKKSKSTGEISIEKSALIGLTFYETEMKGDERRLRAHFIKSIYELAWQHLN